MDSVRYIFELDGSFAVKAIDIKNRNEIRDPSKYISTGPRDACEKQKEKGLVVGWVGVWG